MEKLRNEKYQSEMISIGSMSLPANVLASSIIFIFMGGISLLLDAGATFRARLIVLPFVGVFIHIAAVWLKGFVSPAFFWLHLPCWRSFRPGVRLCVVASLVGNVAQAKAPRSMTVCSLTI